MKPYVIKFMNDVRVWHPVDTELTILETRVQLLLSVAQSRTPTWVPRVIDMYGVDTIREILDRPVENGRDTVTAHDLCMALVNFNNVLSHCRQKRLDQIYDALRQSGHEDPKEEHLFLATSLFSCKRDRSVESSTCYSAGIFTAGEAITHHCLNCAERCARSDLLVRDRIEQLRLVCCWVVSAGGSSGIMIHEPARALAVHLIQLAQLDPKTATFEDMDKTCAWFDCSCTYCKTNLRQGKKRVMDWRRAVSMRPT
jgi:hypothetical protein